MRKLSLALAFASVAGLTISCASQPPRELVTARQAYQRASQSPGAPMVQSDLYEARRSLGLAEKKFSDDGDEQETRDLAYIAARKALSAQAKGSAVSALKDRELAERDLQQFRQQIASQLQGELAQTKEQLAEAERRAQSDRAARAASDDALAKIKELQVKQTERGTMLTLSGAVLFQTGKSTLLPNAQKRLSEVAEVLKQDQRPIIVTGHTDSVGSDDKNEQLSMERADAVRKFLTSKGIDESRIRAEGMGEKEPVADNKSPEGRANNRRVEMLLQDSEKAKQAPPDQKQQQQMPQQQP